MSKLLLNLFKVSILRRSIKYWKPENEFLYSPPWRACPDFTSGGVGVGLQKRYSLFWFSIFYTHCHHINFKQLHYEKYTFNMTRRESCGGKIVQVNSKSLIFSITMSLNTATNVGDSSPFLPSIFLGGWL